MGLFNFLGSVEQKAQKGVFHFLKPIEQAGVGIAKQVGHTASIPFDIAKTVPAALTGNKVAEANATKKADTNIHELTQAAQAIPRGVVQVRQSIAHVLDPNNPTTGDLPAQTTPLGKAVLGETPVQTLQSQFKQTKKETGSTAEAISGTTLSFLADVAGGHGAVKGAVKTGELGVKAATTAAESAKPLNSAGAVPVVPGVGDASAHVRVSTDQLNVLSKADNINAVQKALSGIVEPGVAQRIAPAILETKDHGIIDNIITKARNDAAPVSEAPPALSMVPAPEVPAPTLQEATVPVKTKPKTFITKTAQTSDIVSPEAKQNLKQVDPQTYEQRSTQKLIDDSQKIAPEDHEKIRYELDNKEHFDDSDVAKVAELTRQDYKDIKTAREAGDTERVKFLVERSSRLLEVNGDRALANGRAGQANIIFKMLTPEGIASNAVGKVSRARRVHENADLEEGTAKDIQNQVEGIGGVEKSDVHSTLQGIVDDVNKQEKTVGEQVAQRIEKTVTPKVKQKADTLVNELTKKIKQESLEPKTTVKKDPLATLREVFKRDGEAKEAYPEAQRILKEKFADNPKALATLDKFFRSELKLPAADTTINSAIKNQILKSGDRVTDIVHKSWDNQKRSVEDITAALTKEGFDDAAAKSLADEVVKRLNKQLGEAKASILNKLAQDAPKRTAPTYLEKIEKLSNLGALDDADYAALARAKLKLPDLTTAQSSEISRLAQEMQGMDSGAEKAAIVRQIQAIIHDATGEVKGNKIVKLFSSFKASKSTGDVSAAGRQAGVLGTRWGKQWKSSQIDSVKAGASQEFYDNGIAAREADSFSSVADEWGLDVVKSDGVMHEEAYPSSYAENVPGFKHVVKASDRAFTYGLSKFRFDVAKKIYEREKNAGNDPAAWSTREKKAMGRYINTSSGRGDLGEFLDKHATTLNTALFSAKLWKSRLDIISPKYYWDLRGTTAEKYALQNLATFTATAATVLGLAEAAGATVETDARSSDFLKIKVGDTRYDILGGLQQNLVFIWREISGEKKSSQTGRVTKLGEKYLAADRLTILSDLFGNKEAPGVSEIFKEIKGKNFDGENMSLKDRAGSLGSLVLPLGISDTASTVKNAARDGGYTPTNIAKGIGKTAPSVVGIGVGTYGIKDLPISPKQTEYVQKLKDSGASKDRVDATKLFYQVSKTTPDRDAAGTDIKAALKANDMSKAIKLAKAYNDKYDHAFDKWYEAHGQYGKDETLSKSYHQGRITDSTIDRYVAAIQNGD